MLHIILVILKIFGLILLTVFAAVILILAAVLLAPARYKTSASWDGTVDSVKWRVKFHWLLHLLSGEAVYEDGVFTWKFRAAWKKFGSDSEDAMEENRKEKKKSEVRTGTDEGITDMEDTGTGEDKADIGTGIGETDKKDAGREKDKAELSEKGRDIKPLENPAGPVQKEAGTRLPEQKNKDYTSEKKEKKDGKKKDKQKDKAGKAKKSFYEKICFYADKIKYTFHKIYANIKSLTDKKENLRRFLTSEVHKNAFSRAVRELKRLLRFLRPKRLEGSIEFGFSDPSHTGYVLAGVSMIYPLIGEYMDISPDFENKVFKGSVLAEGKVRAIYFVILAWNLFFDRNVRATYRHIRKFKL